MYEPDLVQTLPAAGLRTVRLELLAAHVVVEASDRSDVRVLASGIRESPELMPSLTRDGETLRIDGESEAAVNLLHQPIRMKLIIQIPLLFNAVITMLAGTLQLTGPFETLDARLRFGTVSGCAPAQRLKLRVFAGDVRLGGLTGAADVQVSLGDLTMAWAHLDGGEAISAHTFSGETFIDLPDHMTLVDGRATVEEDTAPVHVEMHAADETERLEVAIRS